MAVISEAPAVPLPAAAPDTPKRRKPKRSLGDRILKGFGGNRLGRYGALTILGLALLWGPALSFVALAPPTYTSSWTLILPGAGDMANVNLESIGNASSNTPSPYGGSSLNPTANYKAIAMSGAVIAAAAGSLNMPARAFGAPQVKLADQTSLIDFSIKVATPDEAHAKALAFPEAFEAQLGKLRNDEASRREAGIAANLRLFKDKLDAASEAWLTHHMANAFLTMEHPDGADGARHGSHPCLLHLRRKSGDSVRSVLAGARRHGNRHARADAGAPTQGRRGAPRKRVLRHDLCFHGDTTTRRLTPAASPCRRIRIQ